MRQSRQVRAMMTRGRTACWKASTMKENHSSSNKWWKPMAKVMMCLMCSLVSLECPQVWHHHSLICPSWSDTSSQQAFKKLNMQKMLWYDNTQIYCQILPVLMSLLSMHAATLREMSGHADGTGKKRVSLCSLKQPVTPFSEDLISTYFCRYCQTFCCSLHLQVPVRL